MNELIKKLRAMTDSEEIEETIYNAAHEMSTEIFADMLRTKWTFNGKRYHDDTMAMWQLLYDYIAEKVADDYYQV